MQWAASALAKTRRKPSTRESWFHQPAPLWRKVKISPQIVAQAYCADAAVPKPMLLRLPIILLATGIAQSFCALTWRDRPLSWVARRDMTTCGPKLAHLRVALLCRRWPLWRFAANALATGERSKAQQGRGSGCPNYRACKSRETSETTQGRHPPTWRERWSSGPAAFAPDHTKWAVDEVRKGR
jgi:hypothetical protein